MASISRETLALQNSVTSAAIIEAFLGFLESWGMDHENVSAFGIGATFECESSDSDECRVQYIHIHTHTVIYRICKLDT